MQSLLAALTAIESGHSWACLLKDANIHAAAVFLLRAKDTGTVHLEEKKLTAHK